MLRTPTHPESVRDFCHTAQVYHSWPQLLACAPALAKSSRLETTTSSDSDDAWFNEYKPILVHWAQLMEFVEEWKAEVILGIEGK